MSKPLVSVVTAVYNGAETLEQTILSVIDQGYENIEYIIIDGGSTDGTLDIINKYDSEISYWISEPDDGIYQAMNKGIKKANGEIIGILNADDRFIRGTIDRVAKTVKRLPQIGVIYGDVKIEAPNRNLIPVKAKYPIKRKDFYGTPIPHVAMFVKKQKYDELGLYSLDYNIASDFEFMLRLFLSDTNFHHIENNFAIIKAGGITDQNYKAYLSEVESILSKHGVHSLHIKTRLKLRFLKNLLVQSSGRSNTIKYALNCYRWIKDKTTQIL